MSRQNLKAATGLVENPEALTPTQAAEARLTGQDGYLDAVAMGFIYDFYKNTDIKSASAYRFCSALESVMDGMIDNFPINKKEKLPSYPTHKRDPIGKVSQEEWENIGVQLRGLAKIPTGAKPSLAMANLRDFSNFIALDPHSADVLELCYIAGKNFVLSDFMSAVTRQGTDRRGAAIARAFGKPGEYKEYGRVFNISGPLISSGLLSIDDPDDPEIIPVIDPIITEAIAQEGFSASEMAERVKGKPGKTDLRVAEDFGQIGVDVDLAVSLLKAALKNNTSGINIALYGPAGGGKTELGKALAEAAGAKIFLIGETDNESEDPKTSSARKRLSQYKQFQAMSKNSANTVGMFDEMEDVLVKGADSKKAADTENKVELNRILETNPVPAIWVANDMQKFHEAVRRRFTLSIYVDYPATMVRAKVWARQCALQNFELSETETLNLARTYAAPPAMVASAIRTAKETGGGVGTIRKALELSAKIVYGSRDAILASGRVPEGFTPRTVNAGDNTEERIENMLNRAAANAPFSLFLEGEKGSGAGSLLRYTAERLGANIAEYTAADLSQPLNTMMEQLTPAMRIMRAFAEAAEGRQFLVINDLEHFKNQPESLDGNWNSPLVKVFMDAVQAHKFPCAATTTLQQPLSEELDFIFTDRMKMMPLCKERSASAYERFFKRPAPESLERVKGLLPGDFAEVMKLAHRLGGVGPGPNGVSDEHIVNLLERRIAFRGVQGKTFMGFR